MTIAYSTEPSVTDGSGRTGSFPCIIVGNHQAISISNAVSTTSNTFQSGVTIVRLHATVDCYVAFGTNPTATNQDMYLNSFSAEVFGVREGWKLSVLGAGGSSGSLSIAEGA